jgi:hypothetical protein
MHAYSIVAHDNGWLGIFPMWYSVGAVIVYGGFALFLKTRTLDAGSGQDGMVRPVAP